jgi:lipopolysaccharide transport system permease protein
MTKALFPPEVLPLVAVLTNLCNFLLSFPLLLAVLLAYGIVPGPSLLALPVIVAVQLLVVLGIVLLLSSVNVPFRDVQHLLTNLLTLWFFFTPILYSVDNVPEKLRPLSHLNFMGHIVRAYQDTLVYGHFPHWGSLAAVAGLGVVLVLIGDRTFRGYRESFAEWL